MRTTAPSATNPHTAVFEEHRRVLLSAAYRVLGTVQDSEDAVQETWLRWTETDLNEVRDARAYLLRAVTRTALNIVRSHHRRREEYPGPWLPEPVATDTDTGQGRAIEIAEEISLALLVVLESLSPRERAAFVLREVFGMSYAEVAATIDGSQTAARQLVRRARSHVRENAPRNPVDSATHRALTEIFLAAAQGKAPLADVVSVMSPEVVLTTDGGGRAKAALRPIVGIEKVLRFAEAVLSHPEGAILEWHLGDVNGQPAVIGRRGEAVDGVIWIEVDNGLITRIDMVRNPDKLDAVGALP